MQKKNNKMKNYGVLVARRINIDLKILNPFLEFPNKNSMLIYCKNLIFKEK